MGGGKIIFLCNVESLAVLEKACFCSSSSAVESLAVSVWVLQIVGKLLNRLARFSCGSSSSSSEISLKNPH